MVVAPASFDPDLFVSFAEERNGTYAVFSSLNAEPVDIAGLLGGGAKAGASCRLKLSLSDFGLYQ